MSKEYIEREATCKDCLHYEVCADPCTKYRYRVPCRKFVNAADVVEVVRCKDCKWRNTPDCDMTCYDDTGEIVDLTEDNDFCSYGERKEQK